MTRRYYAMGRTATEAVAQQESAREGMLEEMGVKPQELRNARSLLKIMGHDRSPDGANMGPQSERLSIAQGEKVILGESHTNADGDRVTVAYRQNGPHYERFRIRESQAGEHTRIVSEHFGGH